MVVFVYRFILKTMPITHNRPIKTLVKWYVDKRSRHVQDARSEIQRRFAYLDWSQQKKIALAFLASGKSDRLWIYAHLMNLWDDSFASKIRENWEQYHEERCGWLVIRYLPKDFVMANLALFKGMREIIMSVVVSVQTKTLISTTVSCLQESVSSFMPYHKNPWMAINAWTTYSLAFMNSVSKNIHILQLIVKPVGKYWSHWISSISMA